MRSSIACVRCRRSKVKCLNEGPGTKCRSCAHSGRECTYPPPAPTTGRRRNSLSTRPDDPYGGRTAGGPMPRVPDPERRQRPRKSTNTNGSGSANGGASSLRRISPRAPIDAFDHHVLTRQVWEELFKIFEDHYSADLPFLHSPTFKAPLYRVSFESSASTRPRGSDVFLLAFLALTARFHHGLTKHHAVGISNPPPGDPLRASEYYAAAALAHMSTWWTEDEYCDLERTQAMLMLGLHEWSMCRGSKAWLIIGMAIRSAQAMGLQYELSLDDKPMASSLPLSADGELLEADSKPHTSNGPHVPIADAFIQQEIRRRTFWSCYIMDRYLSSGKYRPQMLHASSIRIQLPASENSFLFAAKVRTLMLDNERNAVQDAREQTFRLSTGRSTGKDDDNGQLEVGDNEGLLSRYIKILEIYGMVVEWSCSGGRRIEKYPPWDENSEFFKLHRRCQNWIDELPRQQTLTPLNIQAHVSRHTGPYMVMHTVYFLCQIMLHREYVPFIPIHCSKPSGPLDPPKFPPETVPEGFWEDSARQCFRSAREIIDLVQICSDWDALVQTPIVGFAIYTVAFVGVYCISFPWMDPEDYMSPPSQPDANSPSSDWNNSKGYKAALRASTIVGLMRKNLHMANGWLKAIQKMLRYFCRVKEDYAKSVRSASKNPSENDPLRSSAGLLSLHEGGGGLPDFKRFERALKEFGALDDEDVEMGNAGGKGNGTVPLDVDKVDEKEDNNEKEDDNESAVKSEEPEPPPPSSTTEVRKTGSGSWSAINTIAGQNESTFTPNSGQFRSYESYSHLGATSPMAHRSPNYAHQVNNFRPANVDTARANGASHGLISPTSHTATTTPSHHSPPFDHGSRHNSWNGQTTPLPNSAHAGAQHQQPLPPLASPLSTSTRHTLPALAPPRLSEDKLPTLSSTAGLSKDRPGVDPAAWLDDVPMHISGDDVAAFVGGYEFNEWAEMDANRHTRTWMVALYNPA